MHISCMGFRSTEIEYDIANFFFFSLIGPWQWVHLYFILKFLWAQTLWSINTSPIILEIGLECKSGWCIIGFGEFFTLDHWSPNGPLRKLLEVLLNLADEGLPICELESNSELNLINILHQRRVMVLHVIAKLTKF